LSFSQNTYEPNVHLNPQYANRTETQSNSAPLTHTTPIQPHHTPTLQMTNNATTHHQYIQELPNQCTDPTQQRFNQYPSVSHPMIYNRQVPHTSVPTVPYQPTVPAPQMSHTSPYPPVYENATFPPTPMGGPMSMQESYHIQQLRNEHAAQLKALEERFEKKMQETTMSLSQNLALSLTQTIKDILANQSKPPS
jgi:hypothetical protein